MKKLFLLAIAFSLMPLTAKAEIKSYGKDEVHWTNTGSDATTMLNSTVYRPTSLCGQAIDGDKCNFSTIDHWTRLLGLASGGYAVQTGPANRSKCSENCDSCMAEKPSKYCIRCNTGYDLVKDGEKTVCQSTSCDSGYFYHSAAYGCQACGKAFGGACAECTASGCTACISGYELKDGQCVQQSCDTGYFYHSTAYGCQACGKAFGGACAECTADGCTACISGYELKDGQCVQQSCGTGYFYHSTAYGCQACGKAFGGACTECTADGCTKCISGYSVKNGACVADVVCQTGCATCSSSAVCTSCLSGYKLYNGVCIQDSIDGSCPEGLSKSSDGCCCVE